MKERRLPKDGNSGHRASDNKKNRRYSSQNKQREKGRGGNVNLERKLETSKRSLQEKERGEAHLRRALRLERRGRGRLNHVKQEYTRRENQRLPLSGLRTSTCQKERTYNSGKTTPAPEVENCTRSLKIPNPYSKGMVEQ